MGPTRSLSLLCLLVFSFLLSSLSLNYMLNRYFARYYGSRTPHFYKWGRHDQESIYADRGVQQGDPVAMLLFSIGTFEALQTIRAQYPTNVITAFADDITLLIDNPERGGDVARRMGADLAAALQKVGCESAPGKSKIITVNSEQYERQYAPEELNELGERTLGHLIMGIPIGTDHYIRTEGLKEAVMSACESFDYALELEANPKYVQDLFRYCCGVPKFQHIMRVIPGRQLEAAMRQIDNHRHLAILRWLLPEAMAWDPIATFTSTRRLCEQTALPMTMGGLGVPACKDVHAAALIGGWSMACYDTQNIFTMFYAKDDTKLVPSEILTNTSVSQHLRDIVEAQRGLMKLSPYLRMQIQMEIIALREFSENA